MLKSTEIIDALYDRRPRSTTRHRPSWKLHKPRVFRILPAISGGCAGGRLRRGSRYFLVPMTTVRGSGFNIHSMQWHQREATWSQADISPRLGIRVQLWDRGTGRDGTGRDGTGRGHIYASLVNCTKGLLCDGHWGQVLQLSWPLNAVWPGFDFWWNFHLFRVAFRSGLNILGQCTLLPIILFGFSCFFRELLSFFIFTYSFLLLLSLPISLRLNYFIFSQLHFYLFLYYVPSCNSLVLLCFHFSFVKYIWDIWHLKNQQVNV
jgi:hypothetical protein